MRHTVSNTDVYGNNHADQYADRQPECFADLYTVGYQRNAGGGRPDTGRQVIP